MSMWSLKLMVVIGIFMSCKNTAVNGYPTGAPLSACENMRPGHGYMQTTDSPYGLMFSDGTISGSSTYTPGTTISVTVIGGNYMGILLQARSSDMVTSTPIGSFSDPPPNTRLSTCELAGDTITHSATTIKNNVTYTWHPPTEDVGLIYFKLTVAQEKLTWWTDHKVRFLTYSAIDNMQNTTPDTSTSTELTTTSMMNPESGSTTTLTTQTEKTTSGDDDGKAMSEEDDKNSGGRASFFVSPLPLSLCVLVMLTAVLRIK